MTTTKNTTPLVLRRSAPEFEATSTSRHSSSVPATRSRMRRLVQVASLPMLFFIALPVVALLLRTSPAQWLENLTHPQTLQAVLAFSLQLDSWEAGQG